MTRLDRVDIRRIRSWNRYQGNPGHKPCTWWLAGWFRARDKAEKAEG